MKIWNGYKVNDRSAKKLYYIDMLFENGDIDYNTWQVATQKIIKEDNQK